MIDINGGVSIAPFDYPRVTLPFAPLVASCGCNLPTMDASNPVRKKKPVQTGQTSTSPLSLVK